MDIPLISNALNTYEWLNDYASFYEKRCATMPIHHGSTLR